MNAATPELDLRVRIAVNTGDALVALDARPGLGEAMVAGDVVNTASRMQQAAPVNGILVGAETEACTNQVVTYVAAAPIVAKGKQEPIPVWVASEVRGLGEGKPLGDAQLVGRSRALDVLRGTWDHVVTDRTPHLVTVFGHAGFGKTRLGAEFMQIAEETGGRTVSGRSLPYRESSAFVALGDQVKRLSGIFESDPLDVAERKLREAVRTLGSVDAEAVASHLAILLGLDPNARVADRETLFFSVRCFIEAVARDQPTLLVFEDAHWADPGLLDLIEQLAGRLHDLPVMLLILARPELLDSRPGWGGGLPAYSAITLQALSASEAGELAGDLLSRLATDERDRRIEYVVATAEGNPLFIEQLAAMVTEQTPGGAGPLPSSLRGIVTARLDALPAEERSLLLDAAVVGKVFWRGTLTPPPEGQARLTALLAALERRDLIRRSASSAIEGDEEYAFKHVLIRDGAYAMLPRARRRTRNAEVARYFEEHTPEVGEAAAAIARHWRDAGEPARAIPFFVAAAEEADRGWAKERVAILYAEALRIAPEGDEELRRRLLRLHAVAVQRAAHVEDVRKLRHEDASAD